MTAEIAGTRRELTRDVDELYDKVAPSRVIERRKASMRGRVTSMKERVMGTAERGAHSAATTGHSAVSAVSAASDTATGAVHAVESRTQGAPLAAGLIAFGAGMVVSALVPASEAETQAAEDHGLVDEAKAVGQQVGDSLKESAAGAADELKASVQDSARTLQEEGRTSAGHVRDDAPGT